MEQPLTWTVEQGPLRLDRWLNDRLPGYSMARVRLLIGEGRVRVNDRPAKKGARVDVGDAVEVRGVVLARGPLARRMDLRVAYEDEDVAVLEKPAGMPAQPLSPEDTDTVVNAALHLWPDLAGVGDKLLEPGLIHRLDRGTSGLMLFARNSESFTRLRHDFRMRRVTKLYRALVWGKPARGGEIRVPIGRHPSEPGLMVALSGDVRYRGKSMDTLTVFRVIEDDGETSLVEAELVTGVMHQLRVHFAYLGHPILGDDRYGPRPDPASVAHALQACRLSFTHPRDGHQLEVSASQLLTLAAKTNFTAPNKSIRP